MAQLQQAARAGARAAIRVVEDELGESFDMDSDETERAFEFVMIDILNQKVRVSMAKSKMITSDGLSSGLNETIANHSKKKSEECAKAITKLVEKALFEAHDLVSSFGVGSAANDCVLDELESRISEAVKPVYEKRMQEKLATNLANLLN